MQKLLVKLGKYMHTRNSSKDGATHGIMEVDAFFIVDTVGKNFNKVVGGPYWSEIEAELKMEKMRVQVGDESRFKIRPATMTVHFKPDEE
jgi:hypothetical protein